MDSQEIGKKTEKLKISISKIIILIINQLEKTIGVVLVAYDILEILRSNTVVLYYKWGVDLSR